MDPNLESLSPHRDEDGSSPLVLTSDNPRMEVGQASSLQGMARISLVGNLKKIPWRGRACQLQALV